MSSDKVGNRTIQRAVGVLRGTLGYAVDAEMIAVNPVVGVQLPKTTTRRRSYLSIKQASGETGKGNAETSRGAWFE